MASGCPKCGTYGNRMGGQYVCPICDISWDTEATIAARARSEFRENRREMMDEWNRAMAE